MKTMLANRRAFLLNTVAAGVAAAASLAVAQEGAGAAKAYRTPGRFEEQIRAFEAADEKAFPPAGAIVCIGSSSMRGWHATIKDDLAPLTVIPRGFGGSDMDEALHVVDRIVVPYKPRAVMVYEGDNDIAAGIAPELFRDTYLAFAAKVRAALPEVRFYVLSVKPSVKRWAIWPQMREANRLLAEACAGDERMTFIDVATPMLDAAGRPRPELFAKDNLHMTRAGYAVWRDAVRPVLLKAEGAFEPQQVARP